MTSVQRVVAGAIAVLLLTPLIGNAATVEELRAQIDDLLKRIEVLQQQLTVSGSGGGQTAGTTAACPRVGVTLRLGSTGDDVTRLQKFLATDATVYPEKIVSGYYGSLTEAAVARWQTRYNIVSSGSPETTGYGQYGPRTASLMAVKCQETLGGTTQQVGGFIKVSPISGAAPLTVTIEATINTTRSCNVATYALNYGDGSPIVYMPISAGVCAEQNRSLVHMYNNPGTYVVTLSAGGHKTQATVVVGGTSSNQPSQSSCASDIADAQAAAAGKICTTQQINLLCPANTSYSYSAPNGCQSSFLLSRGWKAEQGAGVTKYDGMSITPDPGSNYLIIQAAFDVGSCDGYEVTWGDGDDDSVAGSTSCSSNKINAKTLAHTYPSVGTYTITLTRGSQTDMVDVAIVAD